MNRSPDEYAGAMPRALALVLDVAVLSAVFFPVTRVVKGTWVMTASDHQWSRGWLVTDPLCLAFLLVMLLYFVVFEAFVGGTPGKLVLRLRVVGADGSPVGLRRAIVRNLLRVVDSLPALGILGAVLIASSNERTRIGDRVAGTRVIRGR
ncbi:MAG: RDD family protein [Acidobacteriota bacterium]